MLFTEFKIAYTEFVQKQQEEDSEAGLSVIRAVGGMCREDVWLSDTFLSHTNPMVAVLSSEGPDPMQRVYGALITTPSQSTGTRLTRVPLTCDVEKQGFVKLSHGGSHINPTVMGYVEGNPGTLVVNGMPTLPEAIISRFYSEGF